MAGDITVYDRLAKMPPSERALRNAFINEAAADHRGDFPAAIREGVARFRGHRQRLGRGVTETSAPTPEPGKRARRIAKAVSEAMTAAAAPKPPPAAPTPAAKAPAASKALHELDADQFGAASAQQFGAGHSSPFWRPQESAPAEPVTETAASVADPSVPLHQLPADELAAHAATVFGGYGRPGGFRSPGRR